MTTEERKPPPSSENEEEEEEPQSTLPPDVVEREAQRAIQEIEEEVEGERSPKPRPASQASYGEEPKGFLDKAWDAQLRVEARFKRIGHGRYSRVVKMARKPDHEEFAKASQITAIGIAIVGFVGFLIYLGMQWLMGVLGVK